MEKEDQERALRELKRKNVNFNFYDEDFAEKLKNPQSSKEIHKFLLHLALCHTVVIQK